MGPASEYSGISPEHRSWWTRDHAWS